jgi:hypothetical protein
MPFARPSRAAAAAASSARLAVLPYMNESEPDTPFPLLGTPSAPVEPAATITLSGRSGLAPGIAYGPARTAVVEGAAA